MLTFFFFSPLFSIPFLDVNYLHHDENDADTYYHCNILIWFTNLKQNCELCGINLPWYPKWHKYSWLQRQSRFDQQGGGGGGFDGGFGNRGPGGMGGQSPMGGQGMPSQSPLFSGAGGGQGGMGNRGGNMDRRREGGPNRDDFDNKRMRRY